MEKAREAKSVINTISVTISYPVYALLKRVLKILRCVILAIAFIALVD